MSRSLYPFHPDLKPYEKQKAIVNPVVDLLLQKPMGLLYHMEKSDAAVRVLRRQVPVGNKAAIRTLIYDPVYAKPDAPCILFLHGGGFVFNAAPHHFALARTFAKQLSAKVVFPDYRLAPKHKFPTAPQDCLAVYRWILSHTDELGICPQNVIVCGDSAGGNLAAVLCLMARDVGSLPLPRAQMLLYPMTDRRMNTESHRRYTDTPLCNSVDVRKYYEMCGKSCPPPLLPYLSPAEAPSLSGLPPAYVEVATYDCLHDEGVAYAQALEKAGVPVELHEIAAAMHGYDIAKGSAWLDRIREMRLRFLQNVFDS